MFTTRCDVPAGATELEASFDFLPAPSSVDGFSSAASGTAQLATFNWNQLLLYPAGAAARELPVRASLTLPAGWRLGTALPLASSSGSTHRFVVASLQDVVDHDWRSFLKERVEGVASAPPLEGLERSGWRLAWASEPPPLQRSYEKEKGVTDLTASIGIEVEKDGTIRGGRLAALLHRSPARRGGRVAGGNERPRAADGKRRVLQDLRARLPRRCEVPATGTDPRAGGPAAAIVKPATWSPG
jgi:predicted metalloprotease with PDZ domain